MYVKKSLYHKVLNHLNTLEDEFETLQIEINTGLSVVPIDIVILMLASSLYT